MRTVFHLALARDWDPNAETYPWSTRGMTIADVGFLHASADEDQLNRVAGRFYRDVTESMLVLTLDEGELTRRGYEIRDEPAEPDNPHAELFPHVYGGDLPTAAVVATRPYVRP